MHLIEAPRRPRILFVSQQIPYPLRDGGNIRTYYILRSLAQAFDVTVVGSAGDADSLTAFNSLGSFGVHCVIVPDVKRRPLTHRAATLVRAARARVPLPIAYNFNGNIRRVLKQLTRRQTYDFYHLNHADAAQYMDCMPGERCIIDTHNLLFDYYEKAASVRRNFILARLMKQWACALRRYECNLFHGAHSILVCSEREKAILSNLNCGQRAVIVPNGEECEYFVRTEEAPHAGLPTVIFLGHLGYKPNLEGIYYFLQFVLPILKRKVPEIHFLIVGKSPPKDLFQAYSGRPDVEITGEVADVRPYLGRSQVLVVPLHYGGGTRLKVLEAFASGVPVVSTTVGAEGILCRDGHDILLADTPEAFSNAVWRLLNNPALRSVLASNARKLVSEKYDWKAIGQSVVRLYQAALAYPNGCSACVS